MHIALDLSEELKEIAKHKFEVSFKTIITTNFKDESPSE